MKCNGCAYHVFLPDFGRFKMIRQLNRDIASEESSGGPRFNKYNQSMKWNPFSFLEGNTAPAPMSAKAFRIGLFCAILLGQITLPCQAAERQIIHSKISAVVTNMAPLRHSSRWTRLNLTIGLPLRDREGLTNLLRQLYDPASTNYHRFLTPAQFAERFGPTEQDYQAVVSFAQSHGLAVTGKHDNRTLVSVRGTVAEVERAFHVTMNEYQHPKESRTFYAPDVQPSLDLAVPVLIVSGLDNYIIPHPCMRPIPAGQAKPNLTGSGPTELSSEKIFVQRMSRRSARGNRPNRRVAGIRFGLLPK